jgi:hypothetical protein
VKAWPLRFLVTGFGSFPGTREKPTARLIRALGAHRARLARGIVLELKLLPDHFAEVMEKLEALDVTLKTDAILHFGLAARQRYFSVETRALNRVSLLHCDVSGARAPLACPSGRLYSCAEAGPPRPAEGGIAIPPRKSRRPDPRRPNRDPRHRPKPPPVRHAPRYCEWATQKSGA